MAPVLPAETGLTVGGVFYRYTIHKDPITDSRVHIQNEDAINGGLLYRNTDDWSGLPGNTITSSFVLPNIPREFFGRGSIEVEGDGKITDPTVIYSYRFDTCADPINNPSCAGYAAAMRKFLLDNGLLDQQIEIRDPLDDQFVLAAMSRETDRREQDNKEESKEEEDKEDDIDMEEALAASDNALAIADGAAQAAMMQALTSVPQFDSYLQATISGGVYNDTISFEPKELPENRNALRVGLAQQLLHQQMVDSQYRLGNANN